MYIYICIYVHICMYHHVSIYSLSICQHPQSHPTVGRDAGQPLDSFLEDALLADLAAEGGY